MQPGTSESLSTSTPANTSNVASPKGPWSHPELDRSPDYVLATLRETKHMITSLQEKEKRLKSKWVSCMNRASLTWWMPMIRKFNGDGLSISLYEAGRRVYDSAIQMEIDAKQRVNRVKYG